MRFALLRFALESAQPMPREVRRAEVRHPEVRPLRCALLSFAPLRSADERSAPRRSRQDVPPPPIPLLDPLLEDFDMFRVRHGRVTSLAFRDATDDLIGVPSERR